MDRLVLPSGNELTQLLQGDLATTLFYNTKTLQSWLAKDFQSKREFRLVMIIPNQAGSIGKDDYSNEEDAILNVESEVETVTESEIDLKLTKLENMLSQLDEKQGSASQSEKKEKEASASERLRDHKDFLGQFEMVKRLEKELGLDGLFSILKR